LCCIGQPRTVKVLIMPRSRWVWPLHQDDVSRISDS
jgi:hypothetical protein